MKKFSDFGIKLSNDSKIFEVPKISITDILNCEIVVIAYQKGITTKHGEDRYIVKIRHNNNDYKFFTNSGNLKQVLDKVPEDGFPFTATIKQQSFGAGSGKTFYFT
ncbi:MAG: hypothetical protein LBQ74_09810 [Prevotella sp.]|jgi:hypothetical protein|nr:hypothetical protein [Prevotella sp.]